LARLVVFGSPADPRKWVVCANEIMARIADGRYPDGEWLPPSDKIAADLGTSSGTVQQALREISAHGLVSRVKNIGYYAGNNKPPLTSKPHANPRPHPNREPRQRAQKGRVVPAEPGDSRSALLLGEQYITVKEFATLFRLSAMTVYRLIHDGELEGVLHLSESMFRIPVSSAREYMRKYVIDGKQINLNELTDDPD
jgi:excisionase family DNA binding protein